MATQFSRFILDYPGRLAMPIGAYAGLPIVNKTVQEVVTRPEAQADAIMALQIRFRSPVLITAMDLSLEAESYGCEIRMSKGEIPAVVGRKAASPEDIEALPIPAPGEARTAVPLETAILLSQRAGIGPVLGCMIGPFSLAGRIYGVSEALEATAAEPETILSLLEKVTAFLVRYARAFREAGAAGILIAEPVAGLLSPASLGRFSTPFVSKIVSENQADDFAVLLHNCGARLAHLNKVLESGAQICHFGWPMNIVEALRQVNGNVILGGNLDPTAVFYSGIPESVFQQTLDLLEKTKGFRNYFISSGCDIAPGTPLANLEAFYQAVETFNRRF